MPSSFHLIQSYSISGSSQTSVTFNSIPSGFNDLMLCASVSTNVSFVYSLNSLVQINSQGTSSTYSGRFAYFRPGDSSSGLPSQTADPTGIIVTGGNTSPSNSYSTYWSYSSDVLSSTLSERAYMGTTAPSGIMLFGQSRPSSGEIITSLTVKNLASDNFVAGSTFYLYGIKKTS